MKIKVYVWPIPKLGIAMRRVGEALARTAPEFVEILPPEAPAETADLQVLHVVGRDALQHLRAPRYAVMMHCLSYEADPQGNGDNILIAATDPWREIWSGAHLVWSYYDVLERFDWGSASTPGMSSAHRCSPPHFYFAPLGVDGEVFRRDAIAPRDIGVLTSGYVSGPKAEAIDEMAEAAYRAGLTVVHLGPERVAGMTHTRPGWQAVSGIPDAKLASIYQSTKWVSGLRHGEGFELPVLEGLACGARPICFDLKCYREFFGQHAAFVPESHGEELVNHLLEVLQRPPRAVTPTERQQVLKTFDWMAIGQGFWRAVIAALDSRPVMAPVVRAADENYIMVGGVPVPKPRPFTSGPKRRVLWVGDSPTTSWTGFGRASKYILDAMSQEFDVTCVGTTHDGSPYSRTEIPYDVYPLNVGVGRIITKLKPSAVIIQHDPWQVRGFMEQCGDANVIASMPIDGLNCKTDYLNGLLAAVWWTKFGADQARLGGYAGPSALIPLGVDRTIYKPYEKVAAREALGWHKLKDAFIVGYIARNQPRKRLDLAVRHFAEWVKSKKVDNAYLYIQTGPTGEAAYDVWELMRYERLHNRLILIQPALKDEIPEARMPLVYSALDVFWSTTQGEGFGLPALEAMACGTPCVLPDWSAYGDWAAPVAHLVPCSEVSGTINPATVAISGVKIAVIGGVPDRQANVDALDNLYRDPAYRYELAVRGLQLAQEPRFDWQTIGQQWVQVVNDALDGPQR